MGREREQRIDIGGLKVRLPSQTPTRVEASGVYLPKLHHVVAGLAKEMRDRFDFSADGFHHGYETDSIHDYPDQPFDAAYTHLYRPWWFDPDQMSAREHAEACKRLDAGPAGKRARELLFSHLSPDQLKRVERNNYFEVVKVEPEPRLDHTWMKVLVFRIHRGFPNGNVYVWAQDESSAIPSDREGKVWEFLTYTICLHPTQPYPTDDICLAQKLMIEQTPDDFVATGNWTYRSGLLQGRTAGPMQSIFPPRKPEQLILPYIKPESKTARRRFRRKKHQPIEVK